MGGWGRPHGPPRGEQVADVLMTSTPQSIAEPAPMPVEVARDRRSQPPAAGTGTTAQIHDQVIANAGAARRSGVQWSHYPAANPQAAVAAEWADVVLGDDVLAACAAFPEGVLVMATVEVEVEP